MLDQQRVTKMMQGLSAVSGIAVFIMDSEVKEGSIPLWKEMKERADGLLRSASEPGDVNLVSEGSMRGEMPLLFTKDLKIFWSVVRSDFFSAYFVSGPVSIRPLTEGQLKRYYNDYAIVPGSVGLVYGNPHVISFETLLDLVITQGEILGFDWTREKIMQANHLPEILLEDNSRREQVLFEMAADQEEIAHHSYEEERYLLQCVREGKTEEALRQNAAMDPQMGRMSKKETSQWRKTLTVAITLCTRAAIEGGLSPAQAYQISDYYLQKSDSCRTPEELINCRNQAVRELANLVHTRKTQHHTSSYVEQCKDYVRKNYKKKIYVADIANVLGISETYLSRLFSKETGQRLQDYISQVRVDKAANLLMYSEESIADIAEYCCFPSQSYFGQVFKKFKGISPNRFRDQYKPREFHG